MDISIDKTETQVTKSVDTSLKWRNQVLHHFNPPSQWKDYKTMESLGGVVMCAQKDKGMQTQACMNEATMNYSLLAL